MVVVDTEGEGGCFDAARWKNGAGTWASARPVRNRLSDGAAGAERGARGQEVGANWATSLGDRAISLGDGRFLDLSPSFVRLGEEPVCSSSGRKGVEQRLRQSLRKS